MSANVIEIAAKKLPVSKYSDDIIFLETNINNLYFPDTLTTAKYGFAKTKIRNNSNKTISITSTH